MTEEWEQPLYAGFGVLVAIDGIWNGWTSDMRVLVAVGVVALVRRARRPATDQAAGPPA